MEVLAAIALFALLGGGLAAILLIAINSKRRASASSPDSFVRDGRSRDVLNVAHVRVAGVGGLGLVLIAALMGLEYPLAAVILVGGSVGGVVGAIAVILYRRRSGPMPSSTRGPGARSVLLTEERPEPSDRDARPEKAGDADLRLAIPSPVFTKTV